MMVMLLFLKVNDFFYPDGKGKMEWERGTKYDGMWKNDKAHGQGHSFMSNQLVACAMS